MGPLGLVALLVAAPAAATAQTRSGLGQVVEGAKKVGKDVEETARGIGKPVTEGAKDVARRGKRRGRGEQARWATGATTARSASARRAGTG